MKKILSFLIAAALVAGCVDKGMEKSVQNDLKLKNGSLHDCKTIQSGQLEAFDGSALELGYDKWGYNYQENIFNGAYCDADRSSGDCPEGEQGYKDVLLIMKWNDAWLSNKSCDGDLKLDRAVGLKTYLGSGAWLTNQISGVYIDKNGNECKFSYFVKIVAAPAEATLTGDKWYNLDGTEIGPAIWGVFAIVQEISNDPCMGQRRLQYVSPDYAGFGNR